MERTAAVGKEIGRRGRRPWGRESGQTLVEFCVLLPVVVVIVMATLELARIYVVQQHLLAAARTATRTGTIRNNTTTDVTDALDTYFASTEVGSDYTSTVTGVSSDADESSTVTVTVNYTLTLFSSVAIPGFSGVNVPLSATVSMRHQ